ncbi:MAG: hypothetical protein OXC26_18870 [Albidovulum sp.]|nr:hypothetical protein [Albidovulum sp.]
MRFPYPAIRSKQTTSDKWLAQFAAPAPDVDQWAGVPQKKRFADGTETAGFQRETNSKRIKSLHDFFLDQDNLIQNPLLCALRAIPNCSVTFSPLAGSAKSDSVQLGELTIEIPDYSSLSFEDIFFHVRTFVEDRVPALKDKNPNQDLIDRLKHYLSDAGSITSTTPPNDDNAEENDDNDDSDASTDEETAGVLFEESHIVDFWQEVAARHDLIKQFGDPQDRPDFLGFTKDALLSYLRPVVLVDGQHRLRGALSAAAARLDDPNIQSEIEDRISNGEDSSDVEYHIIQREARRLPLSLLMSTEPAEQVFQFIVVNQKATPIGRALLGTIVSTTLSNDELENVADRLKHAGIHLEDSQAITYLARHPDSPFYNLIERGLAGDKTDLLQWNVFASLISIFRELRGGRLYHQRRADYAMKWGQSYLSSSAIIAKYEATDYETPIQYWSSLDGPWRDVFIAFWHQIREVFAVVDDRESYAYWGRPRDSNLFNKVSLTILAADFFQFLVETKATIDAADEVPKLVDSWLEEVNKNYFNRNWQLSGIKKDSTGIRSQWASIWAEYRKMGGNLPHRSEYRKPRGE